ncbi:MAG: hypothetical protein AABX70_03075 [Nanoarchaeota archaeon]
MAGLSISPLKTLYRRHKANVLIEQTESELGHLERKLHTAEECAQNNVFLTPAEREGVQQEARHAKEELSFISSQLATLRGVFDTKDYQKVRDGFDPTFQATEQKTTPLSEAQEENVLLDQQLGLCNDKKDLRNAVYANDQLLKARLKKPEAFGAELPVEVALLPKNLQGYVPNLTPELEQALHQLDSKLYNSLGANLIRHQPALGHILSFGSDRVKQTAQGFYDVAFGAYIQVKPLNDKLPVWYKPKLDGTYDKAAYERLLREQTPVVNLVQTRDNPLQTLDEYLTEFHEQYYVIVADHTQSETSKEKYDWDDSKFKTVKGYSFGYVLRTKTPTEEHDEEIHVGDKYYDAFDCGPIIGCSWDYDSDQQIGYVREWKRFHDDRQNMTHGTGLNPYFETEQK